MYTCVCIIYIHLSRAKTPFQTAAEKFNDSLYTLPRRSLEETIVYFFGPHGGRQVCEVSGSNAEYTYMHRLCLQGEVKYI